jgi:NADH-quinone oxidoreductase subunit E
MNNHAQEKTVPSEALAEIVRKYPNAGREALIPVLQEIQEKEGYLSREAIRFVGTHLDLPASKIYGVATFYNQFRFKAPGKYHFMICRGTACHVKGSKRLLESLVKLLKIQPGETSRDHLFSLEVVACMGACGLAPVVSVNGEFHARATPRKLTEIIQECRSKEATRGNN